MGHGAVPVHWQPVELKCGNCRIVMDFGFPAMAAVVLLWGQGMLRQMVWVCVLHELGHALAMWLTHAGIREIRLYAAGLQMRTDTVFLSKGALLAVYLSGPAVNLCMAALLHGTETGLLHLCIGAFNLLPFRVLDGGAALRCLLEDRPQCLRVLEVSCFLLAAGLVGAAAAAGLRQPAVYGMAVYLALCETGSLKFVQNS